MYIYTYIYMYICVCVCMYIYVNIHKCVYAGSVDRFQTYKYAYIYICMYTCIYIYMYIYIYTYIYIYVRIYIFTYVYIQQKNVHVSKPFCLCVCKQSVNNACVHMCTKKRKKRDSVCITACMSVIFTYIRGKIRRLIL